MNDSGGRREGRHAKDGSDILDVRQFVSCYTKE